jgi:hypothetical protein
MIQSFGYGEGVHFAANAFAGFERGFQVMSGDLDGERVGDHSLSTLLIFRPCGQGERHPDRASIHEEFNVNGVGVARSDGDDQRLV